MLIKKNNHGKAQAPPACKEPGFAAMAIFKIFREHFAFQLGQQAAILIGNKRFHGDLLGFDDEYDSSKIAIL